MSNYKKIAIGIILAFFFVIAINIVLNYWIKKQLPIIIFEKNKTAYHINYKKIEVSLWSRNIYATTLLVHPKNQLENSKVKIGIYSKIESITIKHFNIWDLAFRDIIQAESITINKARVILYKKDEKLLNNSKNIGTQIIEPFEKIIAVKNIYLNNGSVDVVSLINNKPILSIKNVILKLEGIVITDAILKEKIPIHYEKYVLICDSLYYKPNAYYHMNIGKISTENNFLKINKFSYLPEFNRKDFIQKLATEKDIYTLKLDSAHIEKMQWGFKNNRFFFKANAVIATKVTANIYRNKIPKDDLSKKYLYNTLLRKINFPLEIDTIHILKSKLVYEEEIDFGKGPGILNFDHLNMQITNLKSGYGATKMLDTKIKVNCQFMKTSPLNVIWSFNVLDQKDGFHIQGTILNFNVLAMQRFTKPYTNTSFTGKFNKYKFDFHGNDQTTKGNAALNYEDLKVQIFKKKHPEKEARLKTAVANLLLKDDSGEKTETTAIELDRIQEKSFYNFLWRSIAESLKNILI